MLHGLSQDSGLIFKTLSVCYWQFHIKLQYKCHHIKQKQIYLYHVYVLQLLCEFFLAFAVDHAKTDHDKFFLAFAVDLAKTEHDKLDVTSRAITEILREFTQNHRPVVQGHWHVHVFIHRRQHCHKEQFECLPLCEG